MKMVGFFIDNLTKKWYNTMDIIESVAVYLLEISLTEK